MDSISLKVLVDGWFLELAVIPIDGEGYSDGDIAYI